MASTSSRAGKLAESLATNRYAQENIRDAAEELRAAFARASKRRVRPAEDAKLRAQVNRAATSASEAVKALRTGRQKPKPRWGRRILFVVGVGTLGAAAAVALSEDLRNALFGDNRGAGVSPQSQATAAPEPTEAAVPA
jgi:hypothetical protein